MYIRRKELESITKTRSQPITIALTDFPGGRWYRGSWLVIHFKKLSLWQSKNLVSVLIRIISKSKAAEQRSPLPHSSRTSTVAEPMRLKKFTRELTRAWS